MSYETELLGLKNRFDGPEFRVVENSQGEIGCVQRTLDTRR